jgi:Leucine-rich repeat (LRR) protein
MEVTVMKISHISKLVLLAALATSNVVFASKRPAEDDGNQLGKHVRRNPIVTLISSDEENFEVPTEFAMQSGTLQHMIEDCEDPNQTATLPNVASATMQNLIPCLEIISMGNGNEAVIKTELSKFINTQDLSQQALEDLLLAANFLDIQPVIDAVTAMYDLMHRAVSFNGFVQESPDSSDSNAIEELRLLARNLTNIIGYCRQLTELRFIFCSITNAELEALAPHLKALTSLTLSGTKVTDAGLQAGAPHLQALTTLIFVICPNITDEGLKAVAQLKALKTLRLDGCYKITDAGLQAIAPHLQTLTSLTLSGCYKITYAGLQAIAPYLKALTELVLSGDNITDAGLKALAQNLKALTSLTLDGSHITDAGLKTLAPYLQALTSLTISFCHKITHAGLQALAPYLQALTLLIIVCCSGVSEAVLKELQNLIRNRSSSLLGLCSRRVHKILDRKAVFLFLV